MAAKERDAVRGNIKWKGSVAGLGGLSGLVDILPFNFCCRVYTLRLFGMSVVFQICLGFFENSRRAEGGLPSVCRNRGWGTLNVLIGF